MRDVAFWGPGRRSSFSSQVSSSPAGVAVLPPPLQVEARLVHPAASSRDPYSQISLLLPGWAEATKKQQLCEPRPGLQ